MLQVLAVTSELFPLVKTGGLADVTGALPLALAEHEVETTTLLPGYPAVLAAMTASEPVHTEADLFGGRAVLRRGRAGPLHVLALDAPHLYARPGNIYTAPDGADWPDNAFRFAALARMAAAIARGIVPGFAPDIVHAHDWQAALTFAYLTGAARRPRTLLTVHNLAFQGLFPASLLGPLGLPTEHFHFDGFEFHGMIGFLKAGLVFADKITTVSPSYAAEIQTQAAGMGLDGLLRYRSTSLSGILNGIDTQVWNPATDPAIKARFSTENPTPRAANKRALQQRFGLALDDSKLLFGVVSRLSWQKGLDLLVPCLGDILGMDAQLIILGTGERMIEDQINAAAAAYPRKIACFIGYDEALAHQIQAGVDALLVPSRFEPCGLTQLYALRYGALPVVSRVGGLADSIIDANEAALAANTGTGIQFPPGDVRGGLQRTAQLWQNQETWRQIQANGMRADVSWHRPAGQYARLYRGVVGVRESKQGQGALPPGPPLRAEPLEPNSGR